MTGGTAYVAGRAQGERFEPGWGQLNADVAAREVPPEDADELRALVEEHALRTGSRKAVAMLARWDETVRQFRQIVPVAPPSAAVVAAPEDSPEQAPKPAA